MLFPLLLKRTVPPGFKILMRPLPWFRAENGTSTNPLCTMSFHTSIASSFLHGQLFKFSGHSFFFCWQCKPANRFWFIASSTQYLNVPWHFLDFLWPKIALAHQGNLSKDTDKKTVEAHLFLDRSCAVVRHLYLTQFHDHFNNKQTLLRS